MSDMNAPDGAMNLELLIKLLRLSASDNDAEALLAVRKATKLLITAGWDWDKLLRGKVTIVADPFAQGVGQGLDLGNRAVTMPKPAPMPRPVPPMAQPAPTYPPFGQRPQATPQYAPQAANYGHAQWGYGSPPQAKAAAVKMPRCRKAKPKVQTPDVSDLGL